MKKTLLVAAASLFVIGQAIAQNQPSGQQSSQTNAAQSEQTQKTSRAAKFSTKSSHLQKVGQNTGANRGHRSHYAARRTEPNQQSGFGPQPGWNQQQGWNWNQQQNPDRQNRRTQRMSSQEPQTSGFGWNWDQGGRCKNGKRPDGSWC